MAAATEVSVPDLGDFADVPVIEIHVALGDVVSRGSPILLLDTGGADVEPPPLTDQQEPPALETADPVAAAREPAARSASSAEAAAVSAPADGPPVTAMQAPNGFDGVHAGPGVRRLARELGLDLTALSGTGPKGRITKEDVIAGVRGPTDAGAAAPVLAASPAAGIPEVPAQDFSKFGPVEVRPLTRIQRLSGPALHRSWLNVPHVTHDDEADITDLDAYRRELDTAAKAEGYRVTLLAFLMKASVSALREFPKFNSSLTPEKDALIYKGYYHLGVAVAKMAPVWDGSAFVPRLMLPLSLSYDHRVIDGALAARFVRYLCGVLEDIRRLVL